MMRKRERIRVFWLLVSVFIILLMISGVFYVALMTREGDAQIVSEVFEADHVVEITSREFPDLVINAGEVVRFENWDIETHTVVISGVSVSWPLFHGDAVNIRFNKAGEFEYFSSLHPD
jgi:plastocyanin